MKQAKASNPLKINVDGDKNVIYLTIQPFLLYVCVCVCVFYLFLAYSLRLYIQEGRF